MSCLAVVAAGRRVWPWLAVSGCGSRLLAGQASREVSDKLNASALTLNGLAKVVFDVYPPPTARLPCGIDIFCFARCAFRWGGGIFACGGLVGRDFPLILRCALVQFLSCPPAPARLPAARPAAGLACQPPPTPDIYLWRPSVSPREPSVAAGQRRSPPRTFACVLFGRKVFLRLPLPATTRTLWTTATATTSRPRVATGRRRRRRGSPPEAPLGKLRVVQ